MEEPWFDQCSDSERRKIISARDERGTLTASTAMVTPRPRLHGRLTLLLYILLAENTYLGLDQVHIEAEAYLAYEINGRESLQ